MKLIRALLLVILAAGTLTACISSAPAAPQPSPTPDLTDLYTFFSHPTLGATRVYHFSYVYAQYDQNMNPSGQKTETGSYAETVSIVNQEFISDNITITGVAVEGKNYLSRCGNFYWVIFDPRRYYIVCSKDYVFSAAAGMSSSPEPYLTASSQYQSQELSLGPEYYAPFDIGKYWNSNRSGIPDAYEASVAGKVTKTIALGTYNDCFQFRFFAVNYNELHYLCPDVGLVAIEVYDHDDYYSAELVSMKK